MMLDLQLHCSLHLKRTSGFELTWVTKSYKCCKTFQILIKFIIDALDMLKLGLRRQNQFICENGRICEAFQNEPYFHLKHSHILQRKNSFECLDQNIKITRFHSWALSVFRRTISKEDFWNRFICPSLLPVQKISSKAVGRTVVG